MAVTYSQCASLQIVSVYSRGSTFNIMVNISWKYIVLRSYNFTFPHIDIEHWSIQRGKMPISDYNTFSIKRVTFRRPFINSFVKLLGKDSVFLFAYSIAIRRLYCICIAMRLSA